MPPPPEVQAQLERERIAKERHVERCGPAGPRPCPRCGGSGHIDGVCYACRGKGEVSWSLDWDFVGTDGYAIANDWRYLIQPVREGFIGFECDGSIWYQSRVMTWDLCREWCEARERDRTKEHPVLPDFGYEVSEGAV